jgi:SAM-dependent methyltransferase
VAGFTQSLPNPVLMRFAGTEWRRGARARVLDLGCGAGRNAIPLARLGWTVFGMDLSWPMLCAAAQRAREDPIDGRLHLALAAMDGLPVRDRCTDLLIAHGIWNLARSGAEFRRALGEAARVARSGPACSSSPSPAPPSHRKPNPCRVSPSCSLSSRGSRSAS